MSADDPSLLARFRRHLAADDAVAAAAGVAGGGTDPIELWGRRIGRAISVVVCIALAYWLGVQLGWWPAP